MRTHSICLAVVVLLLGPSASAQWVQTNGPYGGDVRCFAVIPAEGGGTPMLFVGTYCGGVFRSTNNGASWTAANIGLTHPAISALAVCPVPGGTGAPMLFAGTCGGIFRSTDAGATWVEASSGLMNTDTRSLAVSPDGGGTGVTMIFAGTAGSGVFRSSDYGASWTAAGMSDACIMAIHANGTLLFAGEPSLSGGGG
jgi:hypothetical protein